MTKIEWTEKSWNPIVGCSLVSPGCTNCYAMKQANRLLDKAGSHYKGTTKKVNGNAVWTGKVALAPTHILTEPLRRKKPTMWFVNSMGDLFHEDVPDEWIDQVFAVMALCPQHKFQILTKRAERMREYMAGKPDQTRRSVIVGHTFGLSRAFGAKFTDAQCRIINNRWPLPNVWLGVSAEDQARANERIPHLLATPAAVRFVSCEPLLGAIDLGAIVYERDSTSETYLDALFAEGDVEDDPIFKGNTLDWAIVGGESGHGARPMHPDWARSLRDQCKAAGVSFFMKQMDKKQPIPDDLMVREWPEVQ